MIRSALLVVAAFGQGGHMMIPFAFTSSYTEYGDQQVYEKREGEICSGFDISIAKLTDAVDPASEIRGASCYDKCVTNAPTRGNLPAGCEGMVANEQEDSDALCVSLEECQNLCWHLDICLGIEMHKTMPRCYMQLWECAGPVAEGTLTDSADYDIYIKQVPWQQSCPLGLSVEVDGGAYGVDGTYLEAEDGVYEAVAHNSRIYWDACQWVIQKQVAAPHTPPETNCVDDVPAANFLFGLVNASYNDHICEIASVAGYCSNLIFAGVCPVTCGVDKALCLENNDPAATALATIWEVTVTGCALKCDIPTQSEGMNGDDPVVQSLCKLPCPPDRRLSTKYQRAYSGFHALDFHELDKHAAAASRMLTSHLMWKSYFWNVFPAVGWKEECTPKSRNVEDLNDMSICDAFRFELPQIGLQIDGICPDQPAYSTTPGFLCALDHVPKDLVEEHRCVTKCAEGQSDPYCDGYDPLFLPDSDALCIPRSECERICTELGAQCKGLDMHRSKNRCFLNALAAEDCALTADSDYLLVEKTMSEYAFTTGADTYCPNNNIAPADLPMTEVGGTWLSEHQCIGAGAAGKCNPFGTPCGLGAACFCDGVVGLNPDNEEDHFALCLDRVHCEEACIETPGCVSFDMHQTRNRCYLNIQGGCKADRDYEMNKDYELVTKVMPLPCYPTIDRNETHADDLYGSYMDGYHGDYKVDGGDGMAYTSEAGGDVTIAWSGCAWEIHKAGMLKFSTRSVTEGPCTETVAPNLRGLEETDLYFAFCPERPLMTMRRICASMSLCPLLTRCVVTTARMSVELEGMRTGGRPDTGLLGDSDMCSTIVTDRTKFVAKQIAAPVRAEYNVDIVSYGPHFMDHLVYRDEPSAPAVSFQSFGAASRATVTLASSDEMYPDNAEDQLGRLYPLMEGFSGFVSDVIRVETFGKECAMEGPMSVMFKVFTPATVEHIQVNAFDARTGALIGHHTTATKAADGVFDVAFKYGEALPVDFVAMADIDECPMKPCGANAMCTNTVGSYTCTCSPGYKMTPNGCVPQTFNCPPISVKVANGESLDFGWRIREMRLYHDEMCMEEVSPGDAVIYQGPFYQSYTAANEIAVYDHPREIVRALQCYTKCDNKASYRGARKLTRARRMQIAGADWANCDGYDRATDNAPEVNTLCASQPTCESVCSQLLTCVGFKMVAKGNRAADKCILYTGGIGSPLETIAQPNAYYNRNFKVEITSSRHDPWHPAELVYDDHGKTSVLTPEAPPYDYTEWWSECYDCAVDQAYVMVTVTLPDDRPCMVHGMRIWQDPEYATQVNVFAGTGPGTEGYWQDGEGFACGAEFVDKPNGMVGEWRDDYYYLCSAYGENSWCTEDGEHGPGWRIDDFGPITDHPNVGGTLTAFDACCECGGGHDYGLDPAEGMRGAPAIEAPALHGKFYDAWSVGAKNDECVSLTCGQTAVLYSGDVIRSIAGVESPCLCKQLCYEAVGDGCQIWGLYTEADTHGEHLGEDGHQDEHDHRICYLMGGDWGIADAEVGTWVSGTVGTVLTGFTPGAPASGESFTLSVTGVHLSESTGARVKIVERKEKAEAAYKSPTMDHSEKGDMGCSGPPAETVSGIGCSDDFICSPQPATKSASTAGWTGISVTSTEETTDYTVCYCPGPCYADWQYTPVPGKMTVEGSGFKWANNETALDRSDGSFKLTVSRPPFHFSLSNNTGWEVKVVSANSNCAAAQHASFTTYGAQIPEGTFPANFNDADFVVVYSDLATSAGRFLVCFRESDTDTWVPISSATTRYLDIALAAVDLVPPAGFYRNQHFTAKAGSTITMLVEGSLTAPVAANLEVSLQAGGCTTLGAGHLKNTTASAADSAGATFTGVSVGTAGRYAVCVMETGAMSLEEVGDITVTARADVGWTYVLDPEGAGSVEITGTGLDWKYDRVMITDCKATCGVSSPAAGVHLEGEKSTLRSSNTFIAMNDVFDTEDDERTLVDLPSELRTYTTVVGHYCKANNLGMAELGDTWEHSCYQKCAADPTIPGCNGYSADVDGPESTALCIPENECREICSLMADCYGIDVWAGGGRCFLNRKGTAADGCKTQFEQASLGPSTSWTFLAKEGSTTVRKLRQGDGLSTAQVLRFKPVAFETGGSYKVCFCDSSLLPAGQQHCHAESDYDIEVGELIVSGVSCLLQEKDFRRRTCYNMFHGGLACSEDIDYPVDDTTPTSGVLPTTQALP